MKLKIEKMLGGIELKNRYNTIFLYSRSLLPYEDNAFIPELGIDTDSKRIILSNEDVRVLIPANVELDTKPIIIIRKRDK